jgi:glucose/mannose transport system substrate-binding protein
MTALTGRRRFLGGLAALLALGAAGCEGPPPDPATAEKTDELEVMSWWTSASERDALKVLTDAFAAANPDVTLEANTVSGGSGSNAQVELARRLADGDPPDVWQGFLGGYLRANAERSQAADASVALTNADMTDVLPEVIAQALEVDGKPYGRPTGAHRSNVLFFNPTVLDKAGVAIPSAGFDVSDLLKALDTLEDGGAVPLGLGGKDAFTSVELFEDALLSVIGADGWKGLVDGSFVWSGPEAREALDLFGKLLDRSDPRASSLTWDGAVAALADGGCGFLAMNDSAYGELVTRGASEGKDLGYVPFPGTDGSFVAVIDVFVAASQGANLANAMAFLATAGQSDVQLDFNAVKGSVPVRTDVDVSSLSAYQQDAARSLREETLLLSAAHGEVVDPRVHVALYEAVAGYAANRDAGAFADTIEKAVVDVPQQH